MTRDELLEPACQGRLVAEVPRHKSELEAVKGESTEEVCPI